MTVPSQTPKVSYTANGATKSFPFSFRIRKTNHLAVFVGLVPQTLGTHYSVTSTNLAAGGSVVFVNAPANGEKVKIYRNMPYSRTDFDYQTSGSFPAATINEDLDSLALQVQQLAEVVDRSMTIGRFTDGVSTALPTPSSLKALRWNAAANALENYEPSSGSNTVSVPVTRVERQTAADGQTVFNLTNTYLPGVNSIQVEMNNAILTSGVDYTETSTTSITLTDPAYAGDSLVFKTNAFVNSPASDSASVAYTPGTSTGQATNVSAYLNLTVKGLKRSFCAVGDGTTNDYTKIAAALTSTGKILEIEDASFYFNTNLPAPTCSQIVGWGEDVSVLKPGAAVTLALSVGGAAYARVFKDFKVDGVSTTNAVGIAFGYGGSASVKVDNVRVNNFKGASGIGVQVRDILKSKFTRLVCQGNGTGLSLAKITSGFPTTTTFSASVFSDNTYQGANLVDGEQILFTDGTVFESNGMEGALLLPTSGGRLRQIIFDDTWFEANWWNSSFAGGASNGLIVYDGGTGYAVGNVLTVAGGTASAAMQITVDAVSTGGVITAAHISTSGTYSVFPGTLLVVTGGAGSGAQFVLKFHVICGDGTSLGGAYIWPEFRATRFSQSTSSCRSVFLTGSAVSASMKVPNFDSALYPSVVVANNAVCDLYDSNARYDYSLTVSDVANRCNYALDGWKDYIPTFATNVGNAAASFSSGPTIAHSRFRKQDKTFHITANFSGTLLAITPTNINITLPTNINIARNTNIAINIDINGTKQTARLATDVSTNKLNIQKPDLSTWASGATFVVMFDAIIEIT